MSTFTSSSKGSVVYTSGTQSFSFLPSYNVFPHPEKLDAIVITPEIVPTEYEKKGFTIKVSEVTSPAHTGRADLIQKLSEYFFKGGSSSGVLSLPEDHFFDTEAERDAALPSPAEGELVAIKQPTGNYLVQKYKSPAWVDQMLLARGPSGTSPSIGANGNWYIGTVDTGVKASGDPLALIKYYGTDGRVRFNPTNLHYYFEVKQPDGTWAIKAEIGKSIIVDTLRLIKGEKPTDIASNEMALYNRELTLSDGRVEVRPNLVLPSGEEFGFVVLDIQTGAIVIRDLDLTRRHLPTRYFNNQGTEIKNADTIKFMGNVDVYKDPNNPLQIIVDVLGQGGSHPGNKFDIYYGFYHGDTIPSSAIKLLTHKELTNPLGDFYAHQAVPPNYFYICLPSVDAAHIGYVAQAPSNLGSIWTKATVLVDGVSYTTIRSPHRLYDSSPTFRTLQK